MTAFALGAAVRFIGEVDDDVDPEDVTAVLVMPSRTQRFSHDAGLEEDEDGALYFDVVLDEVGPFIVRFKVDGDPPGFAEQRHQVLGASRFDDDDDVVLESSFDEIAMMREALRDIGIETNGRSDAYVAAAFETVTERLGR